MPPSSGDSPNAQTRCESASQHFWPERPVFDLVERDPRQTKLPIVPGGTHVGLTEQLTLEHDLELMKPRADVGELVVLLEVVTNPQHTTKPYIAADLLPPGNM